MPTLLDTLWQLQLQPDSDPAPLFNHAAPSADEGQTLQANGMTGISGSATSDCPLLIWINGAPSH
mgnify:CR=1 FL=1